MENDIAELEEGLRRAQLERDTEFFERLLDDEFKFVTPQGHVVNKSQDIQQYKTGFLKMSAVEVSDRTVEVLGLTAVAKSRVKFEGKAGAYPFSSLFDLTRIYSKATGQWRLVSGHSKVPH